MSAPKSVSSTKGFMIYVHGIFLYAGAGAALCHMRLKESADNWRAHAVKNRHFRHDCSEPQLRFRPVGRNKQQWCRGKIGVLHAVFWRRVTGPYWFDNSLSVEGHCLRCGKHLFKRLA